MLLLFVTPSNVKTVESNHESVGVKSNGVIAVEPKTVSRSALDLHVVLMIELSDDDSEVEIILNVKDKTVRPSTEKIKFIKTARETVDKICDKKNKGNQTNGITGTRKNIVTGQAEKKTKPEQEYIIIPICITDPLISQDPKASEEDAEEKPTEMDEMSSYKECGGKSGHKK
ncbi:hypothetical protein Tco_1152639 [Tanacetum coccineum]